MYDIEILKTNGINVDEALESFGTMDLYNEILMDFLNASDERFKELKEYKENNELKKYAIIVHSIKGECGYLGINNLENMSYDHQLKCEENDIEYINNNFYILIEEFSRIINVIKKYFKMQ